MKLLNVTVEECAGAPNGTYWFADPRTSVPFSVSLIRGGPGSGKTSLLRAVAALKRSLGTTGNRPRPGELLRKGATEGCIRGRFRFSDSEQKALDLTDPEMDVSWHLHPDKPAPREHPQLAPLFSGALSDQRLGKVVHFPSGRRLASVRESLWPSAQLGEPAADSVDNSVGLTHAVASFVLRDGQATLELLHKDGVIGLWDRPDSLATLREALRAELPDFWLHGARFEQERPIVELSRRDGAILELHQLSSGEQEAFIVTATLVLLDVRDSVILLDEPELHRPGSAHDRCTRLMRWGSDNQLITASDAPELAAHVPARQQIVLGAASSGSVAREV